MASPNLFDPNTGDVYMRGTNNYRKARSMYEGVSNTKTTTNIDSLREELEAYSYDDLVQYYKESIDPDGTEDLTGMDESDIREAILERVEAMSGGKERPKARQSRPKERPKARSKAQRKTQSKARRKTRTKAQRKARRNRRSKQTRKNRRN